MPDKNIRLLGGKPLLAYSIEHANASCLISRTIVSTDSARYADIAREYGAEVPFLRPVEFAQDDSTDLQVFVHALDWLQKNEGKTPEICVHLRPTHPIRNVGDIDTMICILLDNRDIDSVRSIAPAPETPFKMWFRSNDGILTPVVRADIEESYNVPRQRLPQVFLQNASVDVVRTSVVLGKNSMTGNRIYGYLMSHNYDIDSEAHFQVVAQQLAKEHKRETKQRTLCIDIDGVVASLSPINHYESATPIMHVISAINTLHDLGWYIVLFTARGSATGMDWYRVTQQQMNEWGVKHHELLLGKPAADYYVDDKMLTIDRLIELAAKEKGVV